MWGAELVDTAFWRGVGVFAMSRALVRMAEAAEGTIDEEAAAIAAESPGAHFCSVSGMNAEDQGTDAAISPRCLNPWIRVSTCAVHRQTWPGRTRH